MTTLTTPPQTSGADDADDLNTFGYHQQLHRSVGVDVVAPVEA